MLQLNLNSYRNTSIEEWIEGISWGKPHLSFEGHLDFDILNFLLATQRHPITLKKDRIDASGAPNHCLLNTRVEKIEDALVIDLVHSLCDRFGVSEEQVCNRKLYVFLNQILNPSSKVRKSVNPPLLGWWRICCNSPSSRFPRLKLIFTQNDKRSSKWKRIIPSDHRKNLAKEVILALQGIHCAPW